MSQAAISKTAGPAADAAVLKCPVCEAVSVPAFRAHGYEVCGCSACGHRFVGAGLSASHVSEVFGDNYFFGGEAGYPDYTELADLKIAHGHYYADLLARYMPPGHVLDAGAATGFILKGLADKGWQGIGLDPNASMAQFGRDRLGLEMHVASLETFSHPDPFDLVALIQVLSHFRDPRAAMNAVARLTRPGGYCLIEYWDRGSWAARLLGRAWHHYSPPSVVQWFATGDLDLLMAQCGFIRTAGGKPQKIATGSYLKSIVGYKFGSWPLGSLITAAVGVLPDHAKLHYPPVDLRWGLYRKSRCEGNPAEP